MDELRETCCSNGSVDTPAKPVNVFADEPDSREVASVIDLDHANPDAASVRRAQQERRGWRACSTVRRR